VREGKSRLKTAFWPLGLGGVLITVAIIALYTPWLPIFDLRHVSIVGNRHTAGSDIVHLSGLKRGSALPSLRLRAAAARIATLPWVKTVELDREFPHGVRIDVTERVPVARRPSADGKCLLIGEGGIVVSENCEGWSETALLSGGSVSGATPGAHVLEPALVRLLDGLLRATLAGLTVRKVDVSDASSTVLVDDAGTRVLLGALNVAASRIRPLEALCRAVNIGTYELIDLRFGGEATLVPRVRR
jgi:cell division protein FtsQ